MVLHERIASLPDGTRKVYYHGSTWIMSVQRMAGGGVVKIWAEELGGKEFVSANYYPTLKLLKPCEMPSEKVERFLLKARYL